MDAFEQIVAMLLQRNGYWVQTSYKVCLTPKEKLKIDNPTCPRWEIDVIAYKPAKKELLVVECKSYLNSAGVRYESFRGKTERGLKAYKLFTDGKLRRVVLSRLKKQLIDNGQILPSTELKLCLAAGNIYKTDYVRVKNYCDKKGWGLFDCHWFKEKFEMLSQTDYENDIAVMASKLANPKI